MTLVAVIMAGGKGERFWPKSRRKTPKQFMKLFGDQTMLQQTVRRISPLIPLERVYVVTGEEYAETVRGQLPGLPETNLILEPEGRDTAPCIGLAALFVERAHPDAVMAVLPADHVIKKEKDFLRLLESAAEVARKEHGLMTMGITPTRPETGYGYIQVGSLHSTVNSNPTYVVRRFCEKPDLDTAKRFLESKEYLWNSGMFVWEVSTIRDMIRQYLPRLHDGLEIIRTALGRLSFRDTVRARFVAFDRISIDYGVMEKAERVYVLPGDIGWDDVGSWTALERVTAADEDGNIISGKAIAIDTRNCTLDSPDKLVVTLGVEDLVIVDTPDVLLICRKDQAQAIKRAVNRLREEGLEAHL